MSTYAVHVSNVAAVTTEQHLHDFFTFCGKITKIDFDSTTKAADIHFEKAAAAKTALMLNGGTLDGAHLTVTSEQVHPDEHGETAPTDGTPFHQSDKPRAAIAAEYLAKGYSLSDTILQRAIDLDSTHGISSRFLTYFNSLDNTLGSKALGENQTISGKVTETVNQGITHAKTIDEQKGITKTASDYYSKAIGSAFGQKVFSFYTTTSKQVLDIHEEARRIADGNKPTPAEAPAPATDATAAPTTAPPTVV